MQATSFNEDSDIYIPITQIPQYTRQMSYNTPFVGYGTGALWDWRDWSTLVIEQPLITAKWNWLDSPSVVIFTSPDQVGHFKSCLIKEHVF